QDLPLEPLPGNSNNVAAFKYASGYLSFAYNHLSSHFNDYSNLQSIMIHENYHWDNGHVPGSPDFSGYAGANELETIVAQINDPTYHDTTNSFREFVAEYLYDNWDNLKDTEGHTLNDAYRIAGVDGYSI
ncbi:MAG: hypothetical protein LBH60_05570, partial [Prevotellaceae bacterium]|nr:hypothetical protein [Prevotellaceae bacterium]